MKTLLALCALAVTLAAQDHESRFTVQKIDAAKVQQLSSADAKVDAAMKAFTEAQTALAKATEDRYKIATDIKSAGNLFESECKFTPQDNSGSFVMPAPRKWRRAEIHADYLLISDGETPCSGWGSLNTLTLSGASNSIMLIPASGLSDIDINHDSSRDK